jgi:amino acid transporter
LTTATRIAKQPPQQSAVAMALRKGSLGVPSVIFFAIGAIGPLLVVAGVMPTFFAVTGLTSAPIFFLAVGLVLALFSVGYVAMARQIRNSGAFYAFVRFGLGRPLGVAAALVALLAYALMQISAFGLFGSAMTDWAATNLHIHLSWYAWALLAWLIVATLGVREVKLSAKVLAVLSLIEIIVIVAISLVGLAHPGAGNGAASSLSAHGLVGAGAGAAYCIAVLGFVGFEDGPVFSEEAKDHKRTVPIATYLTVGGITVVYLLVSLAMTVHYGTGNLADTAAQQGSEMLFALSGGILASVGRALFLTSVFAALLAYHNAVGRYAFSLGRESVLPTVFGRTSHRSGAPWVASLVQSGLGLIVILVYAAEGWDPLVHLFYYLGTTGGFGVLTMLTTTSVAVVAYFARDAHGEPLWRRLIAPTVAGVLLIAMAILATSNYATLLGVAPGSAPARLLPAVFLIPTLAGLVWALVLRRRRRAVYQALGMGAEAPLLSLETAR